MSTTTDTLPERIDAAIIGAGPAGLMAAEKLAAAGICAHVFDTMPTAGRKFLLAGKGGLNVTHTEPLEQFRTRYGARTPQVASWLQAFGPQQVCEWSAGLGVPTMVGSSGRVFTHDM
ncbi:MAG: NAD(P)/FAD-dependent oxidoreductase, partial [Rhodocyclaceae bacterium]|nr:NAD(P)/FAD-dependent oxidoreductase [Rhodocyclaceae bacterium]